MLHSATSNGTVAPLNSMQGCACYPKLSMVTSCYAYMAGYGALDMRDQKIRFVSK